MATTDNVHIAWTPKVGDRVTLAWGLGRTKGDIIENRGPLAGGGRQTARESP